MIDRFFPFKVDFRGGHGSREFESIAELSAWLATEKELFKPFCSIETYKNEEPLSGLISHLQSMAQLPDLLQQTVSAEENNNGQQVEANFNTLRKRLNSIYLLRGIPPGNSAEVISLTSFIEQDPLAALAALHSLSDPQNPGSIQALQLNHTAHSRGVGLAAIIRFAILPKFDTADNNKKTIDQLLASIHERTDRSHQILSTQIKAAENVLQKLKEAYEKSETDYSTYTKKVASGVDESINEAQERINAFKKGYQAEIALKEPVTYWQEKAEQHALSSNRFGIAALATALVAGYLAITELPSILQVDKGEPPPYFGIAITVAVSTLALWLLRVLVRSYLGQSHLKSDADERVAMVKTYLALMESNRAPTDTLGPVLSALFRPASDGLVKDDSMPLGLTEFLTRQQKQ